LDALDRRGDYLAVLQTADEYATQAVGRPAEPELLQQLDAFAAGVSARFLCLGPADAVVKIFTDWFHEGKLFDSWTQISPVMQSAKPAGALQVYKRLAKFDKATGNVVTVIVRRQGSIEGLVSDANDIGVR
jgi:hypothetical protein